MRIVPYRDVGFVMFVGEGEHCVLRRRRLGSPDSQTSLCSGGKLQAPLRQTPWGRCILVVIPEFRRLSGSAVGRSLVTGRSELWNLG